MFITETVAALAEQVGVLRGVLRRCHTRKGVQTGTMRFGPAG